MSLSLFYRYDAGACSIGREQKNERLGECSVAVVSIALLKKKI